MATKKFRYLVTWLLILPAMILALLASGCLWGVVRDAENGVGLSGVTVTYTDANGHTLSTTTAAGGLYVFDVGQGPVPGIAQFEVSADGYSTTVESRSIQYDDNPGATLANPSSFWEVQSFALHREGAQSIETELTSVDISHAVLAAAAAGSTDYVVGISAYDPDDPGGSLCHLETDRLVITSPNPPPRDVNLECSVPGDTLAVRVYVGVRRTGKTEEHDTSTAGFAWDPPSLETGWQSATLDSADAVGPDDPDLSFTAELEYRSVED